MLFSCIVTQTHDLVGSLYWGGGKTMWSAMPKEHASMQTGKYQAIDKKVVYEFIIMTSNLTGIAVEKLVEPSYTAWTLQWEQRV